jgi:hypothetical protein
MGAEMSDEDSKFYPEILATGKDYIPRNCPKICDQIQGHQENIVTYGRRVFCRRKKAALAIPEKPAKMIPVAEAIEIDQEAIRRYDDQIKVLVDRKGRIEAEIESMRAFA